MWFFTIERCGPNRQVYFKNVVATLWQNVVDELGMWQEPADDLISGPDSDPADQWDTKRKLFILAEVCAPPSAVLVHCGIILCIEYAIVCDY